MKKRFAWSYFLIGAACIGAVVGLVHPNSVAHTSLSPSAEDELNSITSLMHNTTENFKTLSGEYIVNYGKGDVTNQFRLRTNQGGDAFAVVDTTLLDGTHQISKYHNKKMQDSWTKNKTTELHGVVDGQTYTGPIADDITPFDYAQTFLTPDLVTDIQNISYDGRNAVEFSGNAPSFMKQRANGATNFDIVVDQTTGVLLKYQLTTPSGQVTESIIAKNMKFNDQINDSDEKITIPNGFTVLKSSTTTAEN